MGCSSIKVDGVIVKKDVGIIQESECDALVEDILVFVESKGYELYALFVLKDKAKTKKLWKSL